MSIRRDFGSRSKICGQDKKVATSRCTRVSFLLLILGLWSGLIVYRLSDLQISQSVKWRSSADKQHFKPFSIAQPRTPIVDREGRLLSVSVPAGSVYVRPRLITTAEAKNRTAKELSPILKISEKEIIRKLNDSSPFVWLARQIPRPLAEEVRNLKLKGVDYELEFRRYYPMGNAASTLIGKVGIDGQGLTGLESNFNKFLQGAQTKSNFARDGVGNMIEPKAMLAMEKIDESEPEALELTIDGFIQQIVDEEIEKGRRKANAAGAMAVLVDSDNGDILAMSQSPHIDHNSNKILNPAALRNLIVETVYEPGSTFKPLIAAAALDAGVTTAGEIIDCENGRYKFSRHIIKDVHPVSKISFRDVIVRSSNIGITKVGARLGAEKLYDYIKSFGFGEESGLGLPGETVGIFRNVKSWAKVDVATHSFGQGIAVTPLQMVRAISAIANDGLLPELRILNGEEQVKYNRVVSVKAARAAREMMYGVTEEERGTGKRAVIEGVRVAGKTGTAQKARKDGRGYEEGKYVASFLGFVDGAPMGIERTLSLIVIIDEPDTDSIYGGTLAAPVFQRIMQRSLSYLSMNKELRKGVTSGYTLAGKKDNRHNKKGPDLAEVTERYDSGRS